MSEEHKTYTIIVEGTPHEWPREGKWKDQQ